MNEDEAQMNVIHGWLCKDEGDAFGYLYEIESHCLKALE